MKNMKLILLLLTCAGICHGQTTQTKYFSGERLDKEVPENKAKFAQVITQNTDGTTTTEVHNLSKRIVVQSQTYKGNEPFGIWKLPYGDGFKTLDYNFPLLYTKESCSDGPQTAIGDYFQNNDSLGYEAPKIAGGETTFYQYAGKNTFYPARAKENGIQGTVYLQLSLTSAGAENIVVKRGVDISLDKEAVRVLRGLRFISPPKLNGKPYVMNCLVVPLKFKLM